MKGEDEAMFSWLVRWELCGSWVFCNLGKISSAWDVDSTSMAVEGQRERCVTHGRIELQIFQYNQFI